MGREGFANGVLQLKPYGVEELLVLRLQRSDLSYQVLEFSLGLPSFQEPLSGTISELAYLLLLLL